MGRRNFSKKEIENMKNKILEMIDQGYTLAAAAIKIKVNRREIYRWCIQDKDFLRKMNEAKKDSKINTVELAEFGKRKLINKGHWPAIKHTLTNTDVMDLDL